MIFSSYETVAHVKQLRRNTLHRRVLPVRERRGIDDFDGEHSAVQVTTVLRLVERRKDADDGLVVGQRSETTCVLAFSFLACPQIKQHTPRPDGEISAHRRLV
jgi:hypothetical protein